VNPSSSSRRENDPLRWVSPFEELLGQSGTVGASPAHLQAPTSVFGTPGHDAAFWDGPQQLPDDCAIKCQQFILQQFTGQHVDEGFLVNEALAHGWYSPGGGTQPVDVGNLLQLHGVGVHRYDHASQFHLAMELAQGHKVIVGVDSAKLSGEDPVLSSIKDALGLSGANHAVVVSGIDTSDPQHVRVLVSDPGTGHAVASYPLEQFLDAWRGSDFFLVATNDPAPPHLPEMAHFDYTLGHVQEIADIPYDQFLAYAAHPADWSGVVHHYVEVHHFVHVHHHFDDAPSMNILHPDDHAIADGHIDPLADHGVDGKHGYEDFADHRPPAHEPLDWSAGSGSAAGHEHFTTDDPYLGQMPDEPI
jgi:hypothetical protein